MSCDCILSALNELDRLESVEQFDLSSKHMREVFHSVVITSCNPVKHQHFIYRAW